MFANDGNQPATCDFGDCWLGGFAELQDLSLELIKQGLSVGMHLEQKLEDLGQKLVRAGIQIVQTLQSHLEYEVEIMQRQGLLLL